MLNGKTGKVSDELGWQYNAYAASAGKLSTDGSVCPAGWRLPVHSGAKSYEGLFSKYIDLSNAPNVGAQSINKITSFPISLSPASTAYMQATYSTDYQGCLWYGSDFLYTLAGDSPSNGKLVRCVSR